MMSLIRYSFDHVPHYAQLWRSIGLRAKDFNHLDDLSVLPYTTKQDVFEHYARMISDVYSEKSLVRTMTGGSTGMPLPRFFTTEELRQHYAIFWDRMRQGVALGDRYATFQGREIAPKTQKAPPYWRENRAANQRLYSMRHLSPEKLEHYAESLVDEPFVYYQGYASIMTVVAEFMYENSVKLSHPPKAVFSTSEQLTKGARSLLEGAWQTKVWDEYCQSECCALIRQCEHGNHHVQLDYGIVEFETVGREGPFLLAEMICTGFIPRAAPLIRYKVGDRVLLDVDAKCPCGAPGPVIKAIRGRTADYILTPDGRKYPHISLIVDLLRNVRGTQVIHERSDAILVNILPGRNYTKEDETHIVNCFRERIGGDIEVIVREVDQLERAPNGKVLSIINRLLNRSHPSGISEDAKG
jgi:phenylacetate-CoA ligase